MDDISIRECVTVSELDECVRMQKDVFGLPDLEISPRRHLIVARQAGGWTLGAYARSAAGGHDRLVGFVLHLAALRDDEVIGYSHMMAVDREYQNKGVGARLKWAQRARALSEGRRFIKWTWEPMQARNAHFNLQRLGVTVRAYGGNFYGTDYVTDPEQKATGATGIDSDRLFASWELSSPRVERLSQRQPPAPLPAATSRIEIPANWTALLKADREQARHEQLRVRGEFQKAFAAGLICAGFEREVERPHYLLYESSVLTGA
jgi:predicted GNAT superfamily acetyltransferase